MLLLTVRVNNLTVISVVGIGVFIKVSIGEISTLASDPNAAINWIAFNVAPFSGEVSFLYVENEVMTFGDETLKS